MIKCEITFIDYNILFLYSGFLNNYNIVVTNNLSIKLFNDNVLIKKWIFNNPIQATNKLLQLQQLLLLGDID